MYLIKKEFVSLLKQKDMDAITITTLRNELKKVQKQMNAICKMPLSQCINANRETKLFYLEKIKSLEFQKINLLDQIIKLNVGA